MRAQQYEAALSVFQEFLNSAPKHLGALRGLSTVYIRLRQYQEAVELLNRALELDPRDFKSMALIADAYFRFGQVKTTIGRPLYGGVD